MNGVIDIFFLLQFQRIALDKEIFMEQIAFNEFYSLMDISGIIIIEDSIEFESSRSAIMYDYLMMENEDRENMMVGILDDILREKLNHISLEYSKYRDKFVWDEVPKRDVEYYIKKHCFEDLEKELESIEESELLTQLQVFHRYGLGVKSEMATGYKGLLEGTKTDGSRLPLRIYKDFSAPEMKNIEEDIQLFIQDDKFFLCIIDNFMHGEPRGKEIIDELHKNKQATKNGICIALSSQKENITRITDEMYVGFVNKTADNIDNEIKQHLIMSQYKIMLRLLNMKREISLQKSFLYANENIKEAVFLSAMAKEEGITNHEILNQWIDLREKYYTYQEGRKEIRKTILLSSLFERMGELEETTEKEDDDELEFQNFEQYDYYINEFLSPPMSGDIFYIKGEYYLLVGQECDLSIRNGVRNNSIVELVPIHLVKNRDMGNYKEQYDYEKLLLGKFLTVEGEYCNISIDCTKREYIDNEILDLCAFNEQGYSQIYTDYKMKAEVKYLLPNSWQQYYVDLRERILNLHNRYEKIKKNEQELGFGVEQLIRDMGASHSNRLVSIIEFTHDSNMIKYDVKRVCRIRNHVLLINKLFLEYRGRQAFNTINMEMGRKAIYSLEMVGSTNKAEGKEATVILTTSRKDNMNTKRRDWVIKKGDLLQFINEQKPDDAHKYETIFADLDDKILVESITGFICKNAIKYTKQEKDGELLLKIQLLR